MYKWVSVCFPVFNNTAKGEGLMFERVLLATDFSPGAAKLIECLKELQTVTRQANRPVLLVPFQS